MKLFLWKGGNLGRRDRYDEKWQELKEIVRKRDRQDRLYKVLTVKEGILLQKYAPKKLLKILDLAHVFPVSVFPHMCYLPTNIVLLNRWSHENLDACKDPITGKPISKEIRDKWWIRLVGLDLYMKLKKEAFHGK